MTPLPVISFSLYGSNQMYCTGAIENTKLAKDLFPEFQCRFYVDSTVPTDTLQALLDLGASIITMPDNEAFNGSLWRFRAVFDTDICIMRDCDARLSVRDRIAVDEWLASGRMFHVIRDHQNHTQHMMAGMWGCRYKNPTARLWFKRCLEEWTATGFWSDAQFLESLWDTIKGDCFIHDEFNQLADKGLFGSKIPTPLVGPSDFIGNKYEANGTPVYDMINLDPKAILVCTNLGLGDHMVCNGMINFLSSRNSHIFTFVKPHNFPTVFQMYKSNKKVHLIEVNTKYDAENILERYPTNKKIITGVSNAHYFDVGCSFDEAMYKLVGIPFGYRWNMFKFDSDTEKEEQVYEDVCKRIGTNNYIFVHDDVKRGYQISWKYIEGKTIVRPENCSSIFDYMTLIDRAAEVHVIPSSFLFMIDSISRNTKLFLHRYARNWSPFEAPQLKKKWKILDE